MDRTSSCIAVFNDYREAKEAVGKLLELGVPAADITLLGETVQEGSVAAQGLHTLDDDLASLGVQDANVHCYKCLIYGGSYLVIVSGDHRQVDRVCQHLEQHTEADVSLHFNAPPENTGDDR